MSEFPYKTILVSGPDAFEFLQAQLAADLNHASLAAWCTPKGRVICLFRVTRTDDANLLTLPAELADGAARRLQMFRFRAKVELAVEDAAPAHVGMTTSYDDWRLANLRAGVPEILTLQSEQYTPHMLNLDLLGAVSVTKGCYPGQEIVSRTHYRGATKRRCLRFESPVPLAPGDKVSDGDRDIGDVLNVIDRDLLAVVPFESRNQSLKVSGHTLLNLPLPYIG